MAQGLIKSKPAKTTNKDTVKANRITKKGPRSIAPKKSSLLRQQKMNKKISSGLTEKMELSLAEKAGHLEMLKGGKKQRQKAKGDKKAILGKNRTG